IYVHPVAVRAPFPAAADSPPIGIPLELVADALLGLVDTLEIACLWTDELGTAELWYRLLNLGLPVAPSAGTDAMLNLYRTMALGSTRVYVRTEAPLTAARYLAALRAGRSFVTSGPMLEFSAQGAAPGDVAKPSNGRLRWRLTLTTATAVRTIE